MTEMKNGLQKNQKTPIPTVVVSRPGILQQSLRVILANLEEIDVLAYAGDGLTAMSQVRKHHPGLLILDHNLLEEEIHALLLAVKEERPETQCLVITPSRRGETRLTEWGADAVVFRNAPQQEMRTTLLQLAHEASLQNE